MSIDESPFQYYWNSNTRFNVPVKVLGVNGENYAVEANGHVYVVPKANISPIKRVLVPPTPPETTAPKPETPYWFTLTFKGWSDVLKYQSRNLSGTGWDSAARELSFQRHNDVYTNEWFRLSPGVAERLVQSYGYEGHKLDKYIDPRLPIGLYLKTIVSQLWEEKNRRDGIVPQ